MRNPGSESACPAVRVRRGTAVVAGATAGLLSASAATASAEPLTRSLQAEPNALTFGLLGPVGLVAVALGVLGMTAGVLRQRRQKRGDALGQAEPAVEQQAGDARLPAEIDAAVVSAAGE